MKNVGAVGTLGWAGLLALTACAPAAPPPKPSNVELTQGLDRLVTEEGGGPVLDPVAVPEPMTGLLRIASPARAFQAWSTVIPRGNPMYDLLAGGAEDTLFIFFGAAGEIVDARAPWSIVSADLDGTFIGALPISDFVEKRASLEKAARLVDEADGRITMSPRRPRSLGLIGDKVVCEIFPSVGEARHHLVCAPDRAAVRKYGPYLTRNVPQMAPASGVRIDLTASLLRSSLDTAKRAETDSERADPAYQLGSKLAEDVLLDLGGIGLDVVLQPQGAACALDLQFATTKSPVNVALSGTNGGPLPATYWKLPADAEIAVYLPGGDPATMKAAAAPLWAKIMGTVPKGVHFPQAWGPFVTQLSSLILTGGPLILAQGESFDALQTELTAALPADKAADPQKLASARSVASGWTLMHVREPFATWRDGLRELIRLDAQSAGRQPLKTLPARAGFPKGPPNERLVSLIAEVAVTSAEKLPAGAIHLQMREAPNSAFVGASPATYVRDIHLFVAEGSDGTWLAMGGQAASARKAILTALDKSGDPQLSSRAELASLRASRTGIVGLASLRGILAAVGSTETEADQRALLRTLEAVKLLPGQGKTPILFGSATIETGDEASRATTTRIVAQVPSIAVLDIITQLAQ